MRWSSGTAAGTTGEWTSGATVQHVQDGNFQPPSVFQVVHREPAVELLKSSASQTATAARWSADHRLAVAAAGVGATVAVVELLCCDPHGASNDPQGAMVLHRSSVHPGAKRGPAGGLEHRTGFKATSWSPLGCDASGRCLLACLTVNHRLTVHRSDAKLRWVPLVDLSALYGRRKFEAGGPEEPREPERRRQTPVCMEWSPSVRPGTSRTDEEGGVALLAVLMQSGDVVLWRFALPLAGESEVRVYAVIDSGVSEPSGLAWCEAESDRTEGKGECTESDHRKEGDQSKSKESDRRRSGAAVAALVVGSRLGPVKATPVPEDHGDKAVKKDPALPLVLWGEEDRLPVENLQSVSIHHPAHQDRSVALVLASRGCLVFWCLLTVGGGLEVQGGGSHHVSGLHGLPIVSLAVVSSGRGGAGVTVYTCSLDGTVRRLTPAFASPHDSTTLSFHGDLVVPAGWSPGRPLDLLPGRRLKSICVSRNGAYLAVVSSGTGASDRNSNNNRSGTKTVLDVFALLTPEEAAERLLDASQQNLYLHADLLDLLRWKALRNGDRAVFPRTLLDLVDRRIRDAAADHRRRTYFWRFKLFLLRTSLRGLEGAWPRGGGGGGAKVCAPTGAGGWRKKRASAQKVSVTPEGKKKKLEAGRPSGASVAVPTRNGINADDWLPSSGVAAATQRAAAAAPGRAKSWGGGSGGGSRMGVVSEAPLLATSSGCAAGVDGVALDTAMEEDGEPGGTGGAEQTTGGAEQKRENLDLQLEEVQENQEVQALMETIQQHLVKQHAKKLLTRVHLQTTAGTPLSPGVVPVRGLLDYLRALPGGEEEEDAEVSELRRKMMSDEEKEHRRSREEKEESCSLCGEQLPFTDHRETSCPNGHRWPRCCLSYRACQGVALRRCLLRDSVAAGLGGGTAQEEPQPQSCTFCDSPMI